jgi:hypothetical protein
VNPRTILVAVLLVGASLLLSVVGIIVLALGAHPIPDVLQNVAVGSMTGLLGLLALPSKATAPPD